MTALTNITRRTFVATAAAAGGGIVFGLPFPKAGSRVAQAAFKDMNYAPVSGGAEINAYIHVAADNTITFGCPSTEMGQGSGTSLFMMFAEEFECTFEGAILAQPTGRDEYVQPLIGLQLTGGSTATPGFWGPMRKAGAQARHMMIQAAAKQWGVDASECSAANSHVIGPSGKSITYGEIAEAAAGETPPEEPTLKTPAEWKVIGKEGYNRLDSHIKVTGRAQYSSDVVIPGMVYGAIRMAPFGGSVKSYDEAAAKASPGVQDVIVVGAAEPALFLDNNVPAVIVTADSTWAAEQGAKAAKVQFDQPAEWANLSDASISKTLHDGLEEEGSQARADGDYGAGIGAAADTFSATYEVPYMSHSPLETMNAVADFRGDSLECWMSTQDPGAGYIVAEMISGLPKESIYIHQTMTGGGFGRRVEVEYLEYAIEASMAIKKPIKLTYSREEDMANHFHRPTYAAKMTAGIDGDGNVTSWQHKISGPGIWLSPYRSSRMKNLFAGSDFINGQIESGVDFHSAQGAKDIGYDFENIDVRFVQKDFPVPIVFLRGVGNTQNAFFIESFIDELADHMGEDPYELRKKLLHKEPRMLATLDLAAEKANWGGSLPKGHAQGIAFHNSFDSPWADVVTLSVRGGKRVNIHNIHRAVDCGLVVNPDQWDAQVQAGVVWGLAHTFTTGHSVNAGQLQEQNFDTYKLPRIGQMAPYEVHAVPTKNDPTGIGEPVFHTMAPAITNAIFAATGKRIRSLPLNKHGMSLA
jgi:isoquinoline 1-oxidoreductase beta subunit